MSCSALAHMLTSRKQPAPVRSRSRSATTIASAPMMPVAASMTGKPVLSGGSPSMPASMVMPVKAWITWS